MILSYLSQSIEIPLPKNYEELLNVFINEFKIDEKKRKFLHLQYSDEDEEDIIIYEEADYTPFLESIKDNKIKNQIKGFINPKSMTSSSISLGNNDNDYLKEIENELSLSSLNKSENENDIDKTKEQLDKTMKENSDLIKNENNNYKAEIENYNSKIKSLEDEKNKINAENEINISKIKQLEEEKKNIVAEIEK